MLAGQQKINFFYENVFFFSLIEALPIEIVELFYNFVVWYSKRAAANIISATNYLIFDRLSTLWLLGTVAVVELRVSCLSHMMETNPRKPLRTFIIIWLNTSVIS